jgi:hypothetical protein
MRLCDKRDREQTEEHWDAPLAERQSWELAVVLNTPTVELRTDNGLNDISLG